MQLNEEREICLYLSRDLNFTGPVLSGGKIVAFSCYDLFFLKKKFIRFKGRILVNF